MAIGERYEAILRAARDVIARDGYRHASIREVARRARLSVAGLYHYVGGKEELLFLVLDRALARLEAELDAALVEAATPAERLGALVRTHLEFGTREPGTLTIVNRDWQRLAGPRRAEIAARREAHLRRTAAVLADATPDRHEGDRLRAAAGLLLGVLDGLARWPATADDPRALGRELTALLLDGLSPEPPRGAGGEGDRAHAGRD